MGIRLRSIRVADYLGARAGGAGLEGIHPWLNAVCGPNNSGKTTLLSAISLLSGFFRAPFATNQGGRFVFGWTPAHGATEDIFNFHDEASECRFEISMCASTDVPNLWPNKPQGSELQIDLKFAVRRGQKRLESMIVEDEAVFTVSEKTPFFRPMGGSDQYTQGDNRGFALVNLTEKMAGRIIYFSSLRSFRPQQGAENIHDLNLLASGMGVISFVRTAMQPDLTDPTSKRRNKLLKEFEKEFASFAKFQNFELSVPPSATELNAHVNGNPLPISRMGAGIGECLLMMLVSKLSKEFPSFVPNTPSIDIVLVEEPELHLHPRLQRVMLDFLIDYGRKGGSQLIFSTHSPTVLNVVQKEGGRTYRTEWDEKQQAITVQPVSTNDQVLSLLRSIGASPGDILQAEKVLWVEGPHDVPVFRAWLTKVPSFQNQIIAVVSLGGDDSASEDFEVKQLKILNPHSLVILDSERQSPGASPGNPRTKTKLKCDAAGITCHLTDLRSTESYFSIRALKTVYTSVPYTLDPFKKLQEQIPEFDKDDCGKIATAMVWSEIEATDVGRMIEDFVKG